MFNRPAASRNLRSPLTGSPARPRSAAGRWPAPGAGKGGMEVTGRIKARPSHTHGKSKTRSRPS
jgi:hypothetical protein